MTADAGFGIEHLEQVESPRSWGGLGSGSGSGSGGGFFGGMLINNTDQGDTYQFVAGPALRTWTGTDFGE